MEYRITYKCRLCGETFYSGQTKNKGLITAEIAKTAAGISGNAHLYYPHHCNDNDIGLADFIGIKAYEV